MQRLLSLNLEDCRKELDHALGALKFNLGQQVVVHEET